MQIAQVSDRESDREKMKNIKKQTLMLMRIKNALKFHLTKATTPQNTRVVFNNIPFHIIYLFIRSKSDGIRSNAARLKGQPFRTMSACSSLEAQHSIEHKQTQTSNMDVKMCHVNERKASKSTNSSNSNGHKRPSSLKLPESQGKTRAKHLYRSRTKPEEPTTSGISPKLSEQRNTVGHHIDNGHADEIFVISTEADVQ